MPAAKDQIMFKIECLVDADKLGTVMWLLSGKVREMKPPVPIIARKKGRNGAEAPDAATAVELFITHLRKSKRQEINAEYAREFCRSIGRAESSYSNMLSDAAKLKAIRNIGKSTGDSRWKILRSAK